MKTQEEMNWIAQFDWAIKGGATRILIWGMPGTGKTHHACSLGEYHSTTLHAGSCPDDLIGGWRLKSNAAGGTSTEWGDGCAVKAMKNGEVLVINEIDHGGNEIVSTLHSILDDPTMAQVQAGNDVIKPKKTPKGIRGFVVIATMNGNPSDLSPSLLDRFDAVIHASVVNPQALEGLPDELQKLARAIVDTERKWIGACTPRSIRSFHRMSSGGVPNEMAAQLCFGHGASDVLTSIGALAD